MDENAKNFIKRCITPKYQEKCPYNVEWEETVKDKNGYKHLETWKENDGNPIRMSAA